MLIHSKEGGEMSRRWCQCATAVGTTAGKVILISMTISMVTSCQSVKQVIYNDPTHTAYAEPTEGPRARVRLRGPAMNPLVYPGTACDRGIFPGAGKPGGPRLGGGFSARDLGMPKTDHGSKPLEIYVRANEPVTMQFSAGGSGAYFCPPAPQGYRMICPRPKTVVPPCTRMHSFVPEVGKDYEMVFTYVNDRVCDVEVFAIASDPGGHRQQRVPSQAAEKCTTPELSHSINP